MAFLLPNKVEINNVYQHRDGLYYQVTSISPPKGKILISGNIAGKECSLAKEIVWAQENNIFWKLVKRQFKTICAGCNHE